MATGNFCKGNSENIYAVEIEHEFDYEDLIANLQSSFENAQQNGVFDTCKTIDSETEMDCNRSYYGAVICEVTSKTKHYERIGDYYISMRIIVRNGYYSGVNLDWECVIHTDYDNLEDFQDDIEISDWHFDLTEKGCELYEKFVNNWKDKEIEEMTNKVEKILKENSIELFVSARFSNGETIYQKVG